MLPGILPWRISTPPISCCLFAMCCRSRRRYPKLRRAGFSATASRKFCTVIFDICCRVRALSVPSHVCVHRTPSNHQYIRHRSLNLDRNSTNNSNVTLFSRFGGFCLGYPHYPDKKTQPPGLPSLEQLALGFIAAMKKEAVLDCEQQLEISMWIYNTFLAPSINRMGVNMASASDVQGTQYVRCNALWALKTLFMQSVKSNYGMEQNLWKW